MRKIAPLIPGPKKISPQIVSFFNSQTWFSLTLVPEKALVS
jgi:hypothetical protein